MPHRLDGRVSATGHEAAAGGRSLSRRSLQPRCAAADQLSHRLQRVPRSHYVIQSRSDPYGIAKSASA